MFNRWCAISPNRNRWKKNARSEVVFSSSREQPGIHILKDKNVRPLRLSKNYKQMLGVPISEAIGKR